MSAIERTNKLHALVRQQHIIIQTNEHPKEVLGVSFCLLFEQLLCALVLEILETEPDVDTLESLDTLLLKGDQWLVANIKKDMSEPGHWLNQWRLERNQLLRGRRKKIVEAQSNLISVTELNEVDLENKYAVWLDGFDGLLDQVRELNNQY